MDATLVKVKQETESIYSYYFKPKKTFSFIPGQYLYLSLPGIKDDPRGNMRQFTISSAPREGLLSITTQIHPQSPFKIALKSLEIGQIVDIDGPIGTLTLNEEFTLPYIFIASGLGVTPFRSIIESFKEDPTFYATLYYFAPKEKTILFQAELASWLTTGRVDVNTIHQKLSLKPIKISKTASYVICGATKVVNFFYNSLIDKGVHEELIATEKLTGIKVI